MGLWNKIKKLWNREVDNYEIVPNNECPEPDMPKSYTGICSAHKHGEDRFCRICYPETIFDLEEAIKELPKPKAKRKPRRETVTKAKSKAKKKK